MTNCWSEMSQTEFDDPVHVIYLIKYLILPVLASLIKDADSVKVVALMPFRFVRTLAFLPKINLMKKFWTLSCRTKYIQSLFIGPNPWPAV